MSRHFRLCILLIVALGIAPTHAGPTIGIYTDLAGTQCTGATANGARYGPVWANDLDRRTGAGVGICCRQDWPGDFFLTFRPESSAALQLGNPLLCPSRCWDYDSGRPQGGTNIAFATCQTGSRVRLFTFLLIEKTPTHDIALRITK